MLPPTQMLAIQPTSIPNCPTNPFPGPPPLPGLRQKVVHRSRKVAPKRRRRQARNRVDQAYAYVEISDRLPWRQTEGAIRGQRIYKANAIRVNA